MVKPRPCPTWKPDPEQYRAQVSALPLGKRLPTAIYLHRSALSFVEGPLRAVMDEVLAFANASSIPWDVVKVDRFEPKVSLLAYPQFFDEPHPALLQSVQIDLVSGDLRERFYDQAGNCPILHRKETMLPPQHERYPDFEELTQAEERAGLLRRVSRIGFRHDWEAFLEEQGCSYSGHRLLQNGEVVVAALSRPGMAIGADIRAKTAIRRRALSQPMRFLVEAGVVRRGWSVFDYGCGVGSDVGALQEEGIEAHGWDPFYFPEESKRECDIVHLGYVLNVIEEADEREEVLRDAYGFARVALSVAVRTRLDASFRNSSADDDGEVLTARGTFQKYFTEDELLDLLTGTLDGTAVRCLPHLYLVVRGGDHRDEVIQRIRDQSALFGDLQSAAAKERRIEREKHLAAVYARTPGALEAFWKVAIQKGKGASIARSTEAQDLAAAGVTPREALDVYRWRHDGRSLSVARKEHQLGLVDAYWRLLCRLGRPPHEDEARDLFKQMLTIGMSPSRLQRWCFERKDEAVWRIASERRSDQVLEDVAMLAFRRRPSFSELAPRLQRDVRFFFGSFRRALERGLAALAASSNTDVVRSAASDAPFGVLTDSALFVCTSAWNRLPLPLRLRIACARLVSPEVLEQDVLRVDLERPEVVGYKYLHFAEDPLPLLVHRLVVDFGRPSERFIDEARSPRVKLLWARHLLVPKGSRQRKEWEQQHRDASPLLQPFLTPVGADERHVDGRHYVTAGLLHLEFSRIVAAKVGFTRSV